MFGMRTVLTLCILVPALLVGLPSCQPAQPETADQEPVAEPEVSAMNTLTPEEQAEGWVLLFNGQDLSGWRGYKMEEVPAGWSVQDGSMYLEARDRGEGYGDLATVEQFADFELKLEWKISPGGNSGVFFRVSEDYEQEFMSGPEVQVIDGSKEYYPDLKETQQAGANYGLHPAAKNVVKPVGEWNQLHLVVNGPHVEHWLNGEKIVEYELWTDEWKDMVSKTKFAQWPGYGLNKTGHIVLQDHGSPVWYRNVKIRRLES